ncbi:hypothetical protein AVEN_50719-1 [Araneus ventricosus]|uniref:Uncharacterized protein n=1 Tax=Araneus ventricosus TaxID=182803 RepID=A0A4Y2HZT9_ARAVE|nr:hypothetical protein AVEN_50719-1 [Araneus ventricosus]
MFSIQSQNSILWSGSSSMRCWNISSLYGCNLLASRLRMTQLWLIPICKERHQVPFDRLLAIAASTYVDISSSVEVFGRPDLLEWATKTVLLNFMISFATASWVICIFCVSLKVRST